MALIQWSPEYSVKVDAMDLEHQKLVEILNKLYDAMKLGKGKEILGTVLEDLIAYVNVHFRDEEALMRQHNFPGLDAHLAEHALFEAKVNDALKAFKDGSLFVTVELMNFLKNWLVDHIQKTDRQYGDFIGKP